jgi:hypothetical protein
MGDPEIGFVHYGLQRREVKISFVSVSDQWLCRRSAILLVESGGRHEHFQLAGRQIPVSVGA